MTPQRVVTLGRIQADTNSERSGFLGSMTSWRQVAMNMLMCCVHATHDV